MTMTTLTVLPEMPLPLFVIVLETMTAVYVGTDEGGAELFPGPLVQEVPQTGGASESSKPLKELGAEPPLS